MEQIRHVLKFFSENLPLFLMIANLALVIITYFYLRETRLTRRIAEKSFWVETSPKVFLEGIESQARLKYEKKEIEIMATFKVKNGGGTEAKNFVGNYKLSSENIAIEGRIGPVPYLFPGQGVSYQTKMLGVTLKDENLAVAKQAMDENKPLIIPKSFGHPIFLELTLKYVDHEGKENTLPYRCEYILHNNSRVFIT